MIKQAPLSYGIVWFVGGLITYLLIKRSFRTQINDFRSQLGDRDKVINFLEKKVELQTQFWVSEGSSPLLSPKIETQEVPTPSLLEPGSIDSKGKQLLSPVLELIHFDFEDVAQDSVGLYFRASKDLVRKAAILHFSLKPISGAVPWTEVQPQIRFKDEHDHITPVSDGIWLGHSKSKVPFRYGITVSLVLATRALKRDFRTYEWDSHESLPLERQLVGDEIRAEVRLVGEYMDDPKADISWYFKLIKGDVPQIILSTREEFDA